MHNLKPLLKAMVPGVGENPAEGRTPLISAALGLKRVFPPSVDFEGSIGIHVNFAPLPNLSFSFNTLPHLHY